VESQNWWGPGDPPVDAPTVMSVVNLVNYNTGQGAAYNTFPKQEALAPKVRWVALPFLAKDKRDPYEPSGTKWTSEIAMTNLDMFPGTSVWRIDFFDQNGLLYSLCQTLNEKQVDYIKLGNIGIIPPGWLGSAVISWQCSAPWDVGALGVVVVEKASGYPSGDLTKAYEGFPLFDPITLPDAVSCPECRQMPECYFSLFGTVTHHETGLPLNGVSIVDKDDIEVAKTDSTGRYFVRMLYSWSPNELHAVLEGYEAVEPVNVAVPQQPCNGAFEANFELSAPVCPTAKVFGTVIDCSDPALLPINGAKVYLDGVHKATTNSTGNYLIEGVDAGTYTLKVEKTGFFVCEQELVVLCGGQYLRDFELNCLAEVKVKVKDDCSGLAIQEATVSVDYTLCCPVGATGTATALTDSNGEATLIVPKGTWTFTISKDSYNTRVEKRAVACGKNDLTATPFSLWPTAWVKGTVFQTPGNPQMGAEVKLVDLATGGHLITTTDAQGKFQFLNVKPGWYVLRYMMGGVAICESAKFEIFYSDALNTAITRVEAMVALNNCTTQTLVGYACGVRVHSTGQLRKCVAAQPTGDPLAAADGMLQYYAAAWLNLPPSHSTGADGRVLFLVDPTGVPIGLPGNGIQYRILFSKTGYLPVAGQPTASITNANQNTMWFDDVCLTPP
ncbi:MAG: carboxypeptidase regulatory-like domain-containing protein, partial [Chloroflexi bacterium]|nr:carboxypeptidase regulatory-like domain-containing protein [Chloroflexota bacterium]